MENQDFARKTMISYGIMLGISSIILSVLNYSFGNIYKPHWVFSALGPLLFIGFIIYGIKALKLNNGGFLKLAQAIKIGLGIALIAGIIAGLYQFIFMNYIEPDYMTKATEFQEQMMYEKFPDMDEAIIEKQLEITQKFSKPGIMIAFSIAGSLIMGLIIALIAGLFMKKDENQY